MGEEREYNKNGKGWEHQRGGGLGKNISKHHFWDMIIIIKVIITRLKEVVIR